MYPQSVGTSVEEIAVAFVCWKSHGRSRNQHIVDQFARPVNALTDFAWRNVDMSFTVDVHGVHATAFSTTTTGSFNVLSAFHKSGLICSRTRPPHCGHWNRSPEMLIYSCLGTSAWHSGWGQGSISRWRHIGQTLGRTGLVMLPHFRHSSPTSSSVSDTDTRAEWPYSSTTRSTSLGISVANSKYAFRDASRCVLWARLSGSISTGECAHRSTLRRAAYRKSSAGSSGL
jgi:hypothetical protein